MSAAWGEPEDSREVPLPNGIRRETEGGGFHAVRIRAEGVAQILKTPEVTAAIEAKTRAMTAFAQSISITKNAEYEAKVLYKDHPIWPARGFVVAENYKAVVDDLYHSTLLKTMAHFPSDAPFDSSGIAVPEPPTAKTATRKDGLWQDSKGRWRNQKGHFAKAPEDDE